MSDLSDSQKDFLGDVGLAFDFITRQPALIGEDLLAIKLQQRYGFTKLRALSVIKYLKNCSAIHVYFDPIPNKERKDV